VRELPRGWAETTLGEICDVNPPVDRGTLEPDEPCSFIPMASVEEETGRLDPSETRLFRDLRSRSYRSFLEEDVLVAKITPSMENGKGAVARGLENGVGFGSTEFHVLRPRADVDPWFILRFVLQEKFRAEAARHMTGTAGQLRVSASYLASASIPLPPLAEQRRIVAAIEEHFSRLDAADESLRRAQRMLVSLRRSVLSSAFEGSWPLKPLVEASDPTRPICYGILKPKTTGNLTVPYVEVRSIQNGRIDVASLHRTTAELHNEFRRSELRAEDVVLAIRGSFDRAAVVPAALSGANVSRDVARISPGPRLDANYLAYYLGSHLAYRFFAGKARGVAVRGVNIGDLKAMPIPLPPLSDQRRIVAEVERRLSLVDALVAAVAAALERSAALRRSILERAFSGKLVPQDPSDEPASVLLERIRAERATIPNRPRRGRSRVN
jgi:type I restriction enzyme S subunit